MSDSSKAWTFLLLAAVFFMIGYFASRDIQRTIHSKAVFDEQVANHGCKVQKVRVNGEELDGETCVLPDGTIFQRSK